MTLPTVLMLGANGTIGACLTREFIARGWRVRALVRDAGAAAAAWPASSPVEWFQGDAMDRPAVVEAAAGCDTIVHAVSPPTYAGWDRVVLPMISNTIVAARAVGGARIVLPGTIYNFDPARTPLIGDHSPQRPRTAKGSIRVELERRLEAASAETPVLIVRAGDYLGDARSSWFTSSFIRPERLVTRVVNPGRAVGHSWAYLPDLARAMAMLLEIPDRLKPFERLQFAGLWDEDGAGITRAIRAAVGRHVPEWGFPWWMMTALSPLNAFAREVREIEPYWRHPVRLDNTRLVSLLGSEPHTPMAEAVARTLWELGCLERPVAPRSWTDRAMPEAGSAY